MAKKNNPTGFEYKILEAEEVEKPKRIEEGNVNVNIAEEKTKEKNELGPEQGQLTYGQQRSIELQGAHDAPGLLYGSPAKMTTTITPLHKKGKLRMSYKK